MIQLYPEFFNDVFGPVMQPGSSSHQAGPGRRRQRHQGGEGLRLGAPMRGVVAQVKNVKEAFCGQLRE